LVRRRNVAMNKYGAVWLEWAEDAEIFDFKNYNEMKQGEHVFTF